jgi:protein-disulfide isomerase-like protein with CxxC motif
MPEVKWVHKDKFWFSDIAKHSPDAVPVLTLDEIEVWLNENNPAAHIVQSAHYADGYDDGRRDMVTDLLAQVQAMREGA